jgi:hypothetical protein
MPDIFVETGICKTLGGPKKAPIYVGLGVAALGIGLVVIGSHMFGTVPPGTPQPVVPSLPVFWILAIAGGAALLTYFTCTGVEAGLRVHG